MTYLHGIALPDFFIAHSITKNENKRKHLPLFGFSVTMPLPRQVPYVTRSVQSTPADNTRKRVWQYIEKERKKERK